MASLSTKTRVALFCRIFTLFFLKIRSEIIPNTAITTVRSVQSAAEMTPPVNATLSAVVNNIIVTTAGHNQATFPLKARTGTESEKPFTQVVSGSVPTEVDHLTAGTVLEEAKTTVANARTTKAPILTSAQLLNKTPNPATTTPLNPTTIPPKTDPQTPANISTALAPKYPVLTTSFTPILDNSSSLNTTSAIPTLSTVQPETNKSLTSTTPGKETTVKYITDRAFNQSSITTDREFNQSSTTTELPTNGSAISHHTRSTENAKNFSTTTESPIKTTFFDTPTTTAEINVTTNATQGGLFPVNTKIPHATTANKVQETTQNPEVQTCSSIGVAKKCLIVIASLAVVSTIFIISTVVLCTKLSSRKYKFKRQHKGTEMMCLSSILPERSNHRPIRYTRQRSPVPNGVLVIHNFDDSDDEAGDNLTLNSFLPENDRYV